jgi:hypothetical protein
MNYESLILLAQTLHEIDEKGSGDLIGITDHKLTIITSIQDASKGFSYQGKLTALMIDNIINICCHRSDSSNMQYSDHLIAAIMDTSTKRKKSVQQLLYDKYPVVLSRVWL